MVSAAIGMEMQKTYLFQDTIRANLPFARPDASEPAIAACEAANIPEQRRHWAGASMSAPATLKRTGWQSHPSCQNDADDQEREKPRPVGEVAAAASGGLSPAYPRGSRRCRDQRSVGKA